MVICRSTYVSQKLVLFGRFVIIFIFIKKKTALYTIVLQQQLILRAENFSVSIAEM